MYFIPKNWKIDFSVGNTVLILSPFFLSFIVESPCSFIEYPISKALARIIVLNVLLPVKYSIANGNSSADVYIKSMRRAGCPFSLLIPNDLVLPLDKTSTISLSLISSSINFLNIFLSSSGSETMMSISPEFVAPRLYDPTISIVELGFFTLLNIFSNFVL